jgi:membrane-bound lytic murein transglycosylase D
MKKDSIGLFFVTALIGIAGGLFLIITQPQSSVVKATKVYPVELQLASPVTTGTPWEAAWALPLNRESKPFEPMKQERSQLEIDGIHQSATQSFISRYSKPNEIADLRKILKRAEPYMPFIKEEIEKRGLPPELLYLPIIESAYYAKAKSPAGAAGLWQFMRNTASFYNLTINKHVDERLDYQKATVAALRRLKESYDLFNDWPLALAAYNAGIGRITRITRAEDTYDYWRLAAQGKLPRETADYVPKFLAVSYICLNPNQFSLDCEV